MTTPTANSIITPQTPFMKTAIATAAETAFNTPTNQVTLVDETTQNPNGLRITSLYAVARAAVASLTNCQLYKKVGSTYTLIDSVVMAVGTPSATVVNQKADFGYSDDTPLILEVGEGLAVAIGQAIANGVVFKVQGGAY